ncbi:unnamed protein product [Cuscuta epithymum]|uniref:Endonuclease/exonuclease/phosphatase domain-containing protein n=1 Tax=Cuscuta epithymum TaxID=186058 RepID=A0AAV0F7T6_9ASTE|nr:unnamed protein product [Cuscuta epithymum]
MTPLRNEFKRRALGRAHMKPSPPFYRPAAASVSYMYSLSQLGSDSKAFCSAQQRSLDSNIRTVEDTSRGRRKNLTFRQQSVKNPQSHPYYSDHHPPPNLNSNQHFNGQQFRPASQLNQTGPRAPPPKALNFRYWEYAKTAPPPHCERFTVLSYNILANYLATNHRAKLYGHLPLHILEWESRKRSLVFELGLWSADVLCLQEVDRFQEMEAELQFQGYSGIWKMRTGDAVDGCAIFWRDSRLKLLQEDSIEFRKHGLRDNVAQICVFELLDQNKGDSSEASAIRSSTANKVVVCNIHVLFNPRRGEMKLGQMRLLLDKADHFSKLWNGAPVVICGDFNSTPKSPLYNFIAERKLDILKVARDKVSGQHPDSENSPKHSSPMNRPNSSTDSVKDASVSHEGEEREACSNLVLSTLSPIVASGDGLSRGCGSQTQNSVVNGSSKTFVGAHFEDKAMERTVEYFTDSQRTSTIRLNADSPHIYDSEGSIPSTLEEGVEDQSSGEDSATFLSELCGASDRTPLSVSERGEPDERSGLSSVSHSKELPGVRGADFRGTYYDPTAWTPIEIQTATGSMDCTVMEHHLRLTSVYREVENVVGKRDSIGEPEATSYHNAFLGTVDYIWRSEGLQTVRVLAPIPTQAMQFYRGFPTKKWGSDHIALVSELAFTERRLSGQERQS